MCQVRVKKRLPSEVSVLLTRFFSNADLATNGNEDTFIDHGFDGKKIITKVGKAKSIVFSRVVMQQLMFKQIFQNLVSATMFETSNSVDEFSRDNFVVSHAQFNGGENPKIIFREVSQNIYVELHFRISSDLSNSHSLLNSM